MTGPKTPATALCTSTPTQVVVRGRSLADELIGRLSFTQMSLLCVLGTEPTAAQTAMVDACLVALMEHGLTPTALAARLTLTSAPESLQGAVAAGLLGVGGRFAGTAETCAALLGRVVASADRDVEAATAVTELRSASASVPGFGHPLHRPEDPRAVRLLALADELGVSGAHVAALASVAAALDAAVGRHVAVNATGAMAAVLADCDIPVDVLRGLAVLARCAGLVAHLHEERERPAGLAIWHAAEQAVPYDGAWPDHPPPSQEKP